jgi:uncharacterized protein YfaT (DUF1175 family)
MRHVVALGTAIRRVIQSAHPAMSIGRTVLVLMLALAGVAAGALYFESSPNLDPEAAKRQGAPGPVRDHADRNGDGTPDSLILDGADGEAFRAWFTFLAESTYYQPAELRPGEVDDCAALLRFAYREALRKHDGVWASALKLPLAPALPPITKYQYPATPIAPNLFRVREGAYAEADAGNGAFAQFADAQTLRRFNTTFLSRDVGAARPGDLLFYRQPEQDMPDHVMIFVGPSHFDSATGPFVVYHTGPDGADPGEIRRPSLAALHAHREPRWHPVPANNHFLGVYRWNILQ